MHPRHHPVRLAVLLMIGHYFENRDNPDKQVYLAMRMAFENLLYPRPGCGTVLLREVNHLARL